MERVIELYSEQRYYGVEGNSSLVIFKTSGDILINTPELGFEAALQNESVRGFSLDEKTRELSVEFLQGRGLNKRPNTINIGIVRDYEESSEWVRAVNELYKTGD